jgi:hypothetical protein
MARYGTNRAFMSRRWRVRSPAATTRSPAASRNPTDNRHHPRTPGREALSGSNAGRYEYQVRRQSRADTPRWPWPGLLYGARSAHVLAWERRAVEESQIPGDVFSGEPITSWRRLKQYPCPSFVATLVVESVRQPLPPARIVPHRHRSGPGRNFGVERPRSAHCRENAQCAVIRREEIRPPIVESLAPSRQGVAPCMYRKERTEEQVSCWPPHCR